MSDFNAKTLSLTKRDTTETPCGCGKRHCRHDRWAFEMLAMAHPHEAAEMNFRRFVAFVRKKSGPLSVKDIRDILDSTWAAYHDFEQKQEV